MPEPLDPLAMLEYRVAQLEDAVKANTFGTFGTLLTILGATVLFILNHVKLGP